jgi:hypothetical protein
MAMIPAFLLVVAAVSYRVATGLAIISGSTWLSNFAPMAAIALCGAVYFRGNLKFTVPLGALFLSDFVLNIYYDAPLFTPLIACRYLVLALIGLFGVFIAGRPSLKTLLSVSLAGSVVFYVVTNIFSWLSDPGYAKTLAGLIQALTVGLPEQSATPTWMFFRNSVISDLTFTTLFFFCMKLARSSEDARAASVLPRPA